MRNLITVLTGAIVLVATVSPGVAAPQTETGTCNERLLKDYGQVIRRLQQKNRGFPDSKGIPIAPTVGIFSLDADQIALGGEPIGYQLRSLGRHGSARQKIVLRLKAELFRIGSHHVQLLQQKSKNLVEDGDTLDRLSKRVSPGLYRLDVRLEDAAGKTVKYREFFKVLPRRLDLRIATNGSRFRVGQKLVGRLENRGTIDLVLPRSSLLNVERQETEGWVKVPEVASDAIPQIDPEFIQRGHATGCTSIRLGSSYVAGTYRVSVLVSWPGKRTWRVQRTFEIEDH